MIRYAISDRTLWPGSNADCQAHLVRQAVTLAREGVDYFQVREKDLEEQALLALTIMVRDAVHATGTRMQVVLNGPPRLAAQASVAWHTSAGQQGGDSCCSTSVHTLDEVEQQRTLASLLLFAPVFGKTVGGRPVQPGAGLQRLREAVERANGTPVLALGGVTPRNAPLCLAVGAAGIAGIRLFQR